MSNENDQYQKLLDLLLEAIKGDQELRDKYEVGEKFRFVRDRLNALKSQLEQNAVKLQEKKKETTLQIAEDEVIVFVYLFNAQGNVLKTWQSMLNPAVFYEYSVNRPIYEKQSSVESYLRSKKNKLQNGYLAVIVKKNDILQTSDSPKDAIDNPLIKVREGALKFEKLVYFNCNNIEYILDESGELVKKVLPTTAP